MFILLFVVVVETVEPVHFVFFFMNRLGITHSHTHTLLYFIFIIHFFSFLKDGETERGVEIGIGEREE